MGWKVVPDPGSDPCNMYLGTMPGYRDVAETGGAHTLRETKGPYTLGSSRESETLTPDSTVLWQKNAEAFGT